MILIAALLPLQFAAPVVVVIGIWALQLWWSKAWLSRFSQGPVEWLWRAATYRRLPT